VARNQRRTDAVVVIGLGRFGESVALELMEQNIDVLGIDGDIQLVDALSGRLTQVVSADSTNEEALRQLSVHEFDRAVIAIGSNIESSILTTSVVLGLGVPHVWAKAISHAHARILAQIGAHHVVRPEHDMGKRVAHLVGGRMLEYIEFEDGFAMAKTNPPNRLLGHPLGRTGVRSEHGVTVVAIKRTGQDFTYATAETVIEPGDTIIVSGATTEVEKFSELT
jgi:trk system potassium uptake protein TrkA